ncbi:unnamed protein product, partial [Phaeothamnion confervicola]
ADGQPGSGRRRVGSGIHGNFGGMGSLGGGAGGVGMSIGGSAGGAGAGGGIGNMGGGGGGKGKGGGGGITDEPMWGYLRNLLKRLLDKDVRQRIDLPQVMRHPWVTLEGSRPPKPLDDNDDGGDDSFEVTDGDLEEAWSIYPASPAKAQRCNATAPGRTFFGGSSTGCSSGAMAAAGAGTGAGVGGSFLGHGWNGGGVGGRGNGPMSLDGPAMQRRSLFFPEGVDIATFARQAQAARNDVAAAATAVAGGGGGSGGFDTLAPLAAMHAASPDHGSNGGGD